MTRSEIVFLLITVSKNKQMKQTKTEQNPGGDNDRYSYNRVQYQKNI